jgi:hypothetical protein
MTNTVIDFPHFLLVSANMLQHLTVELPFHESYRAARSFKTEYQDQLGELFLGAPLVSGIPVPRPFNRLRSCKYSLSLVSEVEMQMRLKEQYLPWSSFFVIHESPYLAGLCEYGASLSLFTTIRRLNLFLYSPRRCLRSLEIDLTDTQPPTR